VLRAEEAAEASWRGRLLQGVIRLRIRSMRKKSELKVPLEVRISATDASRSFSRLLDEVESGRRFVVQRRGRDLCTIAPAAAEGRRASECLDLLRARTPVLLDDGFGEDLLRVLAEETPEERPSWGS
jgi:antitoxin (DNA-binding transcriptional repressor) of toxin-antitoxin stability system